MRVDYAPQIRESESDLNRLEDRHRGTPACDRVRMLRLLRSRRCANQHEVADLLGFSPRQIRRWWMTYQSLGLEALLDVNRQGGSQSRISPDVWEALSRQIHAGHLCLLKEVQHYLLKEHGIEYRSLQGVRDMLKSQGLQLPKPASPSAPQKHRPMRTRRSESVGIS